MCTWPNGWSRWKRKRLDTFGTEPGLLDEGEEIGDLAGAVGELEGRFLAPDELQQPGPGGIEDPAEHRLSVVITNPHRS